MKTWHDETWHDQMRFGLRVRNVLFSQQSRYQKVEILETHGWGRALLLDDVFMTSEADEFFYHEMLTHPMLTTAPAISSVLIIGGGDGGVLREVLRHPEVQRCLLVELDPLVVDACRQHLFDLGAAWQDPRLQLAFQDGFDFAQRAAADSFDVILVDGCDPEGPAACLATPLFFAACRRILKQDGVFGIQSGSPFLMPDTYSRIRDALLQSFDRVHPYFGPAPIYAAGPWSYMHCSRFIDPLAVDPRRAARISAKTRYWSVPVHRGAFAVPPFAAH